MSKEEFALAGVLDVAIVVREVMVKAILASEVYTTSQNREKFTYTRRCNSALYCIEKLIFFFVKNDFFNNSRAQNLKLLV